MPPHCDSLDGPVVSAARRALEAQNVDLVLPFVPVSGESEVRRVFDKTLAVRKLGDSAREVADLYFFETVVRIHRAGEGAPFTGLKPAGLDVGPAIPAAEQAIDSGSADSLIRILQETVAKGVEEHLDKVRESSRHRGEGVAAEREYVEAALGLQVYSHHLYKMAQNSGH